MELTWSILASILVMKLLLFVQGNFYGISTGSLLLLVLIFSVIRCLKAIVLLEQLIWLKMDPYSIMSILLFKSLLAGKSNNSKQSSH